MVPGMNVARLTSNTWAVSARGFNEEYANKLLVQVDGRTVYDPDFSGVFWHLQNLVLEDIEKIEVVRGPGATMWGANAVNGIVNITTKQASETLGGLLVAEAGSRRPSEGSFRYGWALAKNAFFRVSGTQTTRSDSLSRSGASGGDSWNLTDGGFRFDWKLSRDTVTVESRAYRGVIGNPDRVLTSIFPIEYQAAGLVKNAGGNVLSRWTHSFGKASDLTIQFYYDRRDFGGFSGKNTQILDFDMQHSFRIGRRNNLMWGIGRRRNESSFHNGLAFGVNPAGQDTDLTSAFVQNELVVVPRALTLTAGTKVENSTFTGRNIQPTVRLAWTPSVRHAAWGSVSHAVSTANRIVRGMYKNVGAFEAGPVTGLVNLYGQPNTRSEGLYAYEAGYRYQANRRLWLDTTAFYNVYGHLSTVEKGASFFTRTPQPPHVVVPLYFGNRLKGETYGAEAVGNYKVNELLTFRSSLSFLRMALHGYDRTVSSENAEGQSPRHQAYVGTSLNLPRAVEVSMHGYFVGALKTFQLPAYARLDVNVAWKKFENLQLNIVGQNLLGRHTEFGDFEGPVNAVTRSIYGKVTWRF
jgi:iron complex outermembrane receptor protein